MRGYFYCLVAGMSLLTVPARGDEPKPGLPYRVAVDADMKAAPSRGAAIRVRVLTEFDYRLVPGKAGVKVAVDRMSLTKLVNGREADYTEIGRAAIVSREDGKTTTVPRADLEPEGVAVLDQFGATLAEIGFNADGGESSRVMTQKKGPLVENNLLDLAMLFHPRFAASQDGWDAPVAFPYGEGQIARGTLHYTRQLEPRKGGLIGVDVAGAVKITGKLAKGEVKKGVYTFKGEQTYDPALGQWVAGRLALDADIEAVQPDGAVFRLTGPIVMTMNRVDDAAEPPKSKRP